MSELITDEFLSESGFKWRQEERQPHKHWVLWLGWGHDDTHSCIEDIGIEVSRSGWNNRNGEYIGDKDKWHCWIISHSGTRKLIHVRYLKTRKELMELVESLTGNKWSIANHMYGNCYNHKIAAGLRDEKNTRRN